MVKVRRTFLCNQAPFSFGTAKSLPDAELEDYPTKAGQIVTVDGEKYVVGEILLPPPATEYDRWDLHREI